MTDERAFDVVVVGAGIAGATLALSLSGHGLAIALVEARPLEETPLPEELAVDTFDPRVSALTPRSVALLQDLDVWQEMADYRYCAYHHMTVWDAEGTGQVEFDRAEVDAPALGYIVENRVIVRTLLRRVRAAADITLLDGCALTGCERQASGALSIALASGDTLVGSLLVAADGAVSPLRDMLGFATREWDYGHRAIVATVQLEQAHQDTAWQRFLPSGPLALLPLPGAPSQYYCSIVWSLQEALSEEIEALDDGEFCSALERAAESRPGAVLATSTRFAFPLRQRHAVDYVQPGVALVGDAAHTIHPLAGQGVNLGLSDVAVLAAEVCAAHQRGAAVGEIAVLKRYQRQRKGENLLMMAAMDGFKTLFEQPALPVRWLRNAGMRGIDRLLPVKQRLMRHAMGLN